MARFGQAVADSGEYLTNEGFFRREEILFDAADELLRILDPGHAVIDVGLPDNERMIARIEQAGRIVGDVRLHGRNAYEQDILPTSALRNRIGEQYEQVFLIWVLLRSGRYEQRCAPEGHEQTQKARKSLSIERSDSICAVSSAA